MKIRLVGGPMGGKVYDGDGRNVFVVRDKKKMTRRALWDWQVENRQNIYMSQLPPHPMVEARYEIAMRPHHNGVNVIMAPCQHPDGSIFYEYMEGSRRDLGY